MSKGAVKRRFRVTKSERSSRARPLGAMHASKDGRARRNCKKPS
ncbi:MAG: hypothetical protein R3F34_02530 [Planctomycetota bacterium]